MFMTFGIEKASKESFICPIYFTKGLFDVLCHVHDLSQRALVHICIHHILRLPKRSVIIDSPFCSMNYYSTTGLIPTLYEEHQIQILPLQHKNNILFVIHHSSFIIHTSISQLMNILYFIKSIVYKPRIINRHICCPSNYSIRLHSFIWKTCPFSEWFTCHPP